MLEEEISTKR